MSTDGSDFSSPPKRDRFSKLLIPFGVHLRSSAFICGSNGQISVSLCLCGEFSALLDGQSLATLPELKERKLLTDQQVRVEVQVIEGAGAAREVDGGADAPVRFEHAAQHQAQ